MTEFSCETVALSTAQARCSSLTRAALGSPRDAYVPHCSIACTTAGCDGGVARLTQQRGQGVPVGSNRSAFCHGERGYVGRSRMPIDRSLRIRTSPKGPVPVTNEIAGSQFPPTCSGWRRCRHASDFCGDCHAFTDSFRASRLVLHHELRLDTLGAGGTRKMCKLGIAALGAASGGCASLSSDIAPAYVWPITISEQSTLEM